MLLLKKKVSHLEIQTTKINKRNKLKKKLNKQ